MCAHGAYAAVIIGDIRMSKIRATRAGRLFMSNAFNTGNSALGAVMSGTKYLDNKIKLVELESSSDLQVAKKFAPIKELDKLEKAYRKLSKKRKKKKSLELFSEKRKQLLELAIK
jgi:hypothetical protein